MKWTKTAPTVPGWYWVRCPDTWVKIMYVHDKSAPGLGPRPGKGWSGLEAAGPIPLPEEPEEG